MASIQGIYIALFNRPADPAGLAFWDEQTKGGSDLSLLIGRLTAAPEYLSRFASLDNGAIVNSIYQSLFGRDAEPAGSAFFLDQLETGAASIETIAIQILDGASGTDAADIAAKITAANLFTTHLDLEIEAAAYIGEEAAQIGRDYLANVDAGAPATPEMADAAILLLFNPGEGQNPGGGNGGGSNPPPSGDAAYGDADIVVLDGTTPIAEFNFQDHESADEALHAARNLAEAAPGSNTLLVQSPAQLSGSYQWIMEEYANSPSWLFDVDRPEWTADAAFFNGEFFDGEYAPTAITGTASNDFVHVYQSDEFDHTVTAGRGDDLIVLQSGNSNLPERQALNRNDEWERELGSLQADGGAGDDIIIAGGGNNNVLLGGAGSDLIASMWNSSDTINGGAGNDVLIGGGDHGLAYDQPHFVFGAGGNAPDYRVDVDDISGEEAVFYLDQGEANGTKLTFLGRLPAGSSIFRIDYDGAETTLTLSNGGGFSRDVDMPAGGVAVINVGAAVGNFQLSLGDAVKAEAATGTGALQLLSEVDFASGDFLTGGTGADAFVYEAGGYINARDQYGSINGADSIADFQSGQDKIVLYAYEYRARELKAGIDEGADYIEEMGFTKFLDAAMAAEAADAQFFFAAGVEGDGYLFIDEYHDGSIDFALKLEGLTSLGQFSENDIDVRNNGPALVGTMPVLLDSLV